MKVDRQSLPGKWYQYWIDKGGRPPRQENLCHFVRVLLFWATIRWFFLARTKKVIAPWTVTLATAITTLIALYPLDTLLVVAVVAVVAAMAVLILLSICGMGELERKTKLLERLMTKKIVGRLQGWFFVLSGIVMTCFRFIPVETLIIIAVLFSVALIATIIGLTGIAVEWFLEKLGDRRYARRMTSQEVAVVTDRGVTRFASVALEYAKARKRKICPFVEFVSN